MQHTDEFWLFMQFVCLCLLIGDLVDLNLGLIIIYVSLILPFDAS